MKNIKVLKYKTSKYKFKYDLLLDSVKSKDNFNGIPFELDKLSYNDVRIISGKLTKVKTLEDVMEIFCIAYKCNDYQFWNMPVMNFFQTKKFLVKEFVYLHKREKMLLANIQNDLDAELWKLAGGETLNGYSNITPLDWWGKTYGGNPEAYSKLKYNTIITYLSYNVKYGAVEKKFNELKYPRK